MNNKKKGGTYDYISNKEWLHSDKLLNFKLLNSLSNKSLNIYKPFVLSENRNVNVLLGEHNVGLIKKNKSNNANRQQIESILRDEEPSLMIKQLINLKDKLEQQRENIGIVLSDHLDMNEYIT